MRRAQLALGLWVLALAACREPSYQHLPAPAAPRAEKKPFTAPQGLTRLRLGLVPYLSEEVLRATHRKLAEHLQQRLGVEIELVVGAAYDSVGDMLGRGEVDFAEMSPYAYVRTRQRMPLRPLAMAIADGSDTAAGYIVVRNDSPRRRLEDLKGARFGYVDPASTTGYLYPRKALRDRGLDPATWFAGTDVLGNHEAVLLAVLDGKVDAGGIYQGAFAALRRSKGVDPLSFRVIAKTLRSPRDLYVARADLAPQVAEAILELLLSIDTRSPEGRALLSPMGINGYVAADPRAYDEVEAAHRAEASATP